MIISSPNGTGIDGLSTLTPAMVRGLFLIWRSELQRGQLAEIREVDGSANANRPFAVRAFGDDQKPVAG